MRNRLLSLFLCVGFLGSLPGVAFSAEAERPNVIVILVDDLGWGDLSCYGSPNVKTPHIDTLARDGMRFTKFRANS